jgi:hypothetical protein
MQTNRNTWTYRHAFLILVQHGGQLEAYWPGRFAADGETCCPLDERLRRPQNQDLRAKSYGAENRTPVVQSVA